MEQDEVFGRYIPEHERESILVENLVKYHQILNLEFLLPKKWCFKGKQHLFYNIIVYLKHLKKKGISYKIKDDNKS